MVSIGAPAIARANVTESARMARPARDGNGGRRVGDLELTHSSASNSRRKAASARRNPVSVNITDLALLTGSEISPLR